MLKVTGKVKDANRETFGPKAVWGGGDEKKNNSFNKASTAALYCSPKHKQVHVDKVGKLNIMDKALCKQGSSLCCYSFLILFLQFQTK